MGGPSVLVAVAGGEVFVGVIGVFVRVGVGVGTVGVIDGVNVRLGVGVIEGVKVLVGIGLGVGVRDGVGVLLGVGVRLGVGVAIFTEPLTSQRPSNVRVTELGPTTPGLEGMLMKLAYQVRVAPPGNQYVNAGRLVVVGGLPSLGRA